MLVRLVLLMVTLAAVTGQDGEQNLPPFFDLCCDMEGFSLEEDTPVGTQVYTLVGHDPERSKIAYGINSNGYFRVDPDTGQVWLDKPLDREELDAGLSSGGDVISVEIILEDVVGLGQQNNRVQLKRLIIVRDANDNRPTFVNTPYVFDVTEKAPINTIVSAGISVVDADRGLNSDVYLSCELDGSVEASTACEYFNISEVRLSEGNFTGLITLTRLLDYKVTNSFTMQIKAEDKGKSPQSSTSSISIQVIDVQDLPPIFLATPYFSTVNESEVSGKHVLSVSAQDDDQGSPRPLQLELIGDVLGYFELAVTTPNATRGPFVAELRTTEVPVDREAEMIRINGGIYPLVVRATEVIDGLATGDTSEANITIVVIDSNDNPPRFSQSEYISSVPEHLRNGAAVPGLEITVSDADVGENAEFELGLNDTNGAFSVFPNKGFGTASVAIIVENSNALDFEGETQKLFKFQVFATDNDGQMTSSDVILEVADENDHRPTFPEDSYSFSVKENPSAETVIGVILATDEDGGEFGEVLYRVTGEGSDRFTVNETSGVLTVSQCEVTCLDAETSSLYSLTFEAQDAGRNYVAVPLFISITDVNDNAPEFEQSSYETSLQEGATKFPAPYVIRATDRDVSEANNEVTYTIAAGNQEGMFDINSHTGEINILKPVTYNNSTDQPGTYTLTVEATDNGVPSLSSTVSVQIRVTDKNTHAPKFEFSSYDASVSELAPPGRSVQQITAKDEDSGVNGIVNYRLGSGSRGNFAINSTSGVITVADDANIVREVGGGVYHVIVYATDSGVPTKLSSSTLLTITVLDENNQKPTFDQMLYTAYVTEQSRRGTTVVRLTAADPDETSDLRYSIINPITARSPTGISLEPTGTVNYQTAFSINERTGDVMVANSVSQQTLSSITLTIQAVDANAVNPGQTATTNLEIFIQARDDTHPVFAAPWTPDNPHVEVTIPEELPVGHKILRLSAYDPGTGMPVSHFEMTNATGDYLSVDETTGDIEVNRRMDVESNIPLTLSIGVRAVKSQGQSAIETVSVNIIDINDNAPVFREDEYEALVKESASASTRVTKVTAVDEDSDSGYSAVVYSLSGTGAENFEIDRESGWISVAPSAVLDRETTPMYQLRVTARDSPDPSSGAIPLETSVLLIVKITDDNDHAPKFEQKSYRSAAVENIHTQGTILQLVAHDADDPSDVFGQLTYSISDRGHSGNLFSINSRTGEIFATTDLIGHARDVPYTLQVQPLLELP